MDKLNFSKAKETVKSWLNPKTFKARHLQGVLLGTMTNATLGEVSAYKLIRQDIRGGEMPVNMTDFLILALSAFEAFLAPFVAWWGFQRRRQVFIWWSVAFIIFSMPWFFIPNANETPGSALCSDASGSNIKYEGMTTRSTIRLVIVILSCICFILNRVACWSHGIAYIDEYAPSRTSVRYAIILHMRILSLLLGDRIMTAVLDTSVTMLTIMIVVGQSVNLIQILFILPKCPPEVDGEQQVALPNEDRGFLLSTKRVLSNSVAMMQMLAMGLMAAALWGYGYNEIEIIMVKFIMFREKSFSADMSDIILYLFLLVTVVYVGAKFARPVLMEFCNLKAIKNITLMSVCTLILYVLITTVPRCDRGEVATIGRNFNRFPECNLGCNCNQIWVKFEPVCSVENMVTYLSPCHAGCNNTESLNGVDIYSNCACTSSGRVTIGSCSDTVCNSTFSFHTMLFFLLVTFTSLALQTQGMLLLRVVDKRDKSVVMGLSWSVVAFLAFGCGHILFTGIRLSKCIWDDIGLCHIQTQMFPYLVGATSALLVLLSVIISIGCWIYLHLNKNKVDKSVNLILMNYREN